MIYAPPAGLLGLPGLDVGGLVEDVVRKLVDLVVPDLAAHWAVALVTWLVALPDLTDADAYPHLNAVRHALVGVGFGLLACTLAASGLHTLLGRPSGALGLQRAVVATIVLTTTTQLASTSVTAVNITTGALITQPLVQDGIDTMLGAALIVGAVTSGLSLGLTVGAALAALFFIAALIIMKIGLTALQAVLLLSAPLVWGLYPLAATRWLAQAWTSGAAAIALVPLAWTLVFTAGALLSADSTLWSTADGAGLPDQLEQLVTPLAAVACFWLAYRAPGFLLAAARTVGLHPIVAGRASAGPTTPRPAGGAGRNGVHTNMQRFTRVTHNGPAGTRPGRSSPPSRPPAASRRATSTTAPSTATTTGRSRPAPGATPASAATTGTPASRRRHTPLPTTPRTDTVPAATAAPPARRTPRPSARPTIPPSPPSTPRDVPTPGRATGTPGPHPVPRPADTPQPVRTPAPPATPAPPQPPPAGRTPPPQPAPPPSRPPAQGRPRRMPTSTPHHRQHPRPDGR